MTTSLGCVSILDMTTTETPNDQQPARIPGKLSTIDQNTQRPIVWVVEFARQMPNTANWTHMLGVRRETGRKMHTMWAEFDARGELVRHSTPRSV